MPALIFIPSEDPFICIFEVLPDEFLRTGPSLPVSGSSRPGPARGRSEPRPASHQQQHRAMAGIRSRCLNQHLDRRDAAKLQTVPNAPAASDRFEGKILGLHARAEGFHGDATQPLLQETGGNRDGKAPETQPTNTNVTFKSVSG